MKKFFLFFLFLFIAILNLHSYDTDIYRQNVKPNVMILTDTSGSMGWGVYEHTIDYGAFYDWASDLGDCDKIAGGCGTNNAFYHDHFPKNEILLVKGNIGVTIKDNLTFTGDPGDPDYVWYVNDVIETGVYIDDNGRLYDADNNTIDANYSGSARITVDSEGYVLFDGQRLPLDRNIKLHNYVTYPDGTIVDMGFAGLLNAPGWYFSGYEGIDPENVAENGDTYIYFFITGNWINMQQLYNLYTSDGERTWETRTFSNVEYTPVTVDIHSPNYPNNYPNNSDETWTITQIDATQIRLHFSGFNLEYNSRCRYDYVKIYKDSITNQNLLDTFCGNKGEFTSSTYTLGTTKKLIIVFHSDYSVTRSGFKIDRYEYLPEDYASTGYKMQTRLEVVRDAMIDVINSTRGKINWALASFSTPTTCNGAKIWQPFNPSLNDDTVRQNIIVHLNSFEANGGTPLGEALQDVWSHFSQKANLLPSCSLNHIIVLSDGYPSCDNDWSRISGITFHDWDNDGWTEDPYQYSSPPPDYFDDVAHWMYTHSFHDKSNVSDPENSHVNIRTHTLSFILSSPLLKDASEESGGYFVAAFNKQQLINAFYSLGIIIANSVSYTAPVVSVDTANKTQSGNYLYMSFFKPKSPNWLGNLKKYKVNYQQNTQCSERTQEEWVIVDQNGNYAVDCDGVFLEDSVSFWSDESDGGEVEKGGVGKVLLNKLNSASLNDPYSDSYRKIYFMDPNDNYTIKRFIPSNLTTGLLDASDTSEMYKIINYIYGYTFDEDGSTHHYPVGKRTWILGSLIHSSPKIIYYENDNKTYIVVGANDGMLHVFNDNTGEEEFALIPDSALTKLKDLNPDSTVERPIYLLDGKVTYDFDLVYNETDGSTKIIPKTLIFGLRRGGRKYYGFDISDSNPLNWRVKWIISGGSGDFSELGYTWSDFKITKIRIKDNATGSYITKKVGIFTGGYDPVEDDNIEPQNDTMGRGIFIVDIDTGELLYSYTYNNNPEMKYCMPASPTIINDIHGYLERIYVADIGGQIWRFKYNSDTNRLDGQIIFKSNPGSDVTSGNIGGNLKTNDDGRKFFSPPTITYLGNCADSYAQSTIGYYTPAIYIGSGDREHPFDTTVKNRFYMIIDDIPDGSSTIYDERNLLDVSNDELDVNSGLSESEKNAILNKLHNAKGWFIKFDEIDDGNNHSGEKVPNVPILFNKRVYFSTFTPVSSDPCNPHGVARIYSLKYCYGIAGINYNPANDTEQEEIINKTDRYREIGQSIPSPITIGIRRGKVWAIISTGGSVPGVGRLGSPNIPQENIIIKIRRWQNILNY